MTPLEILLLYIAFRLKQYACDFLLQTDWMALHKGQPGKEGYKALFTHTAFHLGGTFILAMILAPSFWWLAFVDFVVHSVVDRVQGVISYKKGWAYTDKMFWWSFGLDQEAHNFTHLAYIMIIVVYSGGLIT